MLDYDSDSSDGHNAQATASDAFKLNNFSTAKRPRVDDKIIAVSAAPDVLSEVGLLAFWSWACLEHFSLGSSEANIPNNAADRYHDECQYILRRYGSTNIWTRESLWGPQIYWTKYPRRYVLKVVWKPPYLFSFIQAT